MSGSYRWAGNRLVVLKVIVFQVIFLRDKEQMRQAAIIDGDGFTGIAGSMTVYPE
ncbi:MAG: hypothetical protein CM15mP115_12000 [Alphaproteobacteria bacterium]|nr:MAG: hypothetical protein CM15mP115_12000 [Alphaproteobacteria bacterium]